MPIFVARDTCPRMMCPMLVPRKGTTGQFAAREVNAYMWEFGADHGDFIVQYHGEAVFEAIAEDVS